MKKIYLSIFTVVSFTLCAQNFNNNKLNIINSNTDLKSLKTIAAHPPVNHAGATKTNSYSKTEAAVDTAGIEFMSDTLIYYYFDNGFGIEPLFGPNTLTLMEFAQLYPYWGAGFNVEKVLFKFAFKWGTASSDFSVNIYNVSNGLPSTVKGSTALNIDDIDTSGFGANYTIATFTNPVNVTTHFAAGIDQSACVMGGTTITGSTFLYSTLQDEPHASANARIKTLNGNWTDLATNFTNPSNVNLIILPVVSDAYDTGIDEVQSINGIKLTQSYPNPTKDFAKIEYQIENAGTISLELIDETGKVVLTQNEGKQSIGKHEIILNVSNLAKGNYFYSLSNGSQRLTKQMLIE